jgi:hypothetical protein
MLVGAIVTFFLKETKEIAYKVAEVDHVYENC